VGFLKKKIEQQVEGSLLRVHVRHLGGETAAPESGHSFSFLDSKLDPTRLGSLLEPAPCGAYPELVFASFKAFAGQTRRDYNEVRLSNPRH
jgi:hypothetical protein